MSKKEWNVNKLAEIKYKNSLKKVTRAMIEYIPSFNDTDQIIGALEVLAGDKRFKELAFNIATKFALQVNSEDIKSWKEASKLQGGSMIANLLKESLYSTVGMEINRIITDNAYLITRMPYEIARKMAGYSAKATFEGLTYKQVANDLKKQFIDYSESRINLIARTESSKASTALTKARSADVGVEWYIWRTALDGNRVRDSHQIMEGVICNWNQPPSPELLDGEPSQGRYHPGGIYNCRCFPEPLIVLGQIKWPAKVHLNGQIILMSKEEFVKII